MIEAEDADHSWEGDNRRTLVATMRWRYLKHASGVRWLIDPGAAGLGEAKLPRPYRRRRSRRHAKLGENIGNVRFHGVNTNHELLGDGGIIGASGDQAQ